MSIYEKNLECEKYKSFYNKSLKNECDFLFSYFFDQLFEK